MHGISCTLSLSCFAAFLGSVCFGWNTGVINNPKNSITNLINESVQQHYSHTVSQYELDLIWGTVVSIFAVGGMGGALFSGKAAELWGRRNGMLINCAVGIAAALMMAISKLAVSVELLIAGRLLVGFCSAVYTGLVPIYLTEIAPKQLRGGIGVLNQLGVVSGLFLSQALSLDEVLGNEELWPVLLGLTALPSLLQLFCFPCCPESPKYLLLTRSDTEAARAALERLRGGAPVEEELAEIQAEAAAAEASKSNSNSSSWSRLWTQRKPLFVGVVLHLSQQLSGINVIFYYSSALFQSVGVDEADAKYATMAVGGIMIVMTGVSIPFMDRLGRRSLHLGGLAGITVSSALFTVLFFTGPAFASIAAALLVVVFFAVGPGSIPWMMMSEMFDQELRAPANAIGVLVNWSANFAVGILFSILLEALQKLVFLPFTVLTAAFLVFLYFYMPETKGKSVEEVNQVFYSGGTVEPNGEAIAIAEKGNPALKYSA